MNPLNDQYLSEPCGDCGAAAGAACDLACPNTAAGLYPYPDEYLPLLGVPDSLVDGVGGGL